MKTRFITRVRRFTLLALILTLVTASNLSLSSARPAVSPVPSPPSSVAGWGDNGFSQLNIPAGLNDATTIAAGLAHNLALKSDGTVVGWGNNVNGEATPPPGLSNVVAIAANGFPINNIPGLSVALQSDGTVVTWGLLGEQSFPGNAVAIAAGGTYILMLQSDGTVVGFGDSIFSPGAGIPPPGLSNVVAIAAGVSHSLALKSDGTVVGWGDNGAGQLNIPPGLSNVTAIAAGISHNLALKSDGTVVGWGSDFIGSGAVIPPPGLSNVVAIAAGGHSLALKSDGTVVGWGDNQACQTTPPSCISGATAIAAGAVHSLTLQGQSCVQVGCPPSPQDQLSALIAEVEALITAGTLTQNQGDGLIDKLNQVIAKLANDQTGAACNQLNAFISQVNAFINDGSLTQAQGQALINAVNAIKADIGC